MTQPKYKFRTTKEFKANFDRLSPENRIAAKEAFKKFQTNPFDPSLKIHKIYKLSGIAKTTVYSIVIKGNLRVIFLIDKDNIVSLDIGTHSIYK